MCAVNDLRHVLMPCCYSTSIEREACVVAYNKHSSLTAKRTPRRWRWLIRENTSSSLDVTSNLTTRCSLIGADAATDVRCGGCCCYWWCVDDDRCTCLTCPPQLMMITHVRSLPANRAPMDDVVSHVTTPLITDWCIIEPFYQRHLLRRSHREHKAAP